MAVTLDVLLALAFALTAVAGLRNGFFRELFAFVGLVGGVVAGVGLRGWVAAQLGHPFFLGTVGGVLLSLAIFLLVFAAVLLTGVLVAKLWEGGSPGVVSRLVGLGLGAVRGYLLVLVLGAVIVLVTPEGNATLAHSRALPMLGPGIEAGVRVLPEGIAARLERRWLAIPFRPAWKDRGLAV